MAGPSAAPTPTPIPGGGSGAVTLSPISLIGIQRALHQVSRWLAGTIVQARLYDRALSPEEIAASFAAAGTKAAPPDNLAAHSIVAHKGAIRSFAVAAKALRAVTLGEDNMIRLWDLESGKLVNELPKFAENKVSCVALLPDGKRGAYNLEQDIAVCNFETGSTNDAIKGHEAPILSLDISADLYY